MIIPNSNTVDEKGKIKSKTKKKKFCEKANKLFGNFGI